MRKELLHPYGYTLSNNPRIAVPAPGVALRRIVHPIILKAAQKANRLPLVVHADERCEGKGKPCIYIASHGFPEDVLNAALAVNQPAYILAGNMEVFFHSFEGFATWLYGGIVFDRLNSQSRKSAFEKMKRVLQLGTGILLFPEGAWNMSDNVLIADLHGGFYDLAMKTGCHVVPVVTHPSCDHKCMAYVGREIDISQISSDTVKRILSYIKACLNKACDLPVSPYSTYNAVTAILSEIRQAILFAVYETEKRQWDAAEASLLLISESATHGIERLKHIVQDDIVSGIEQSIIRRIQTCLKAIISARKRIVITEIRELMASYKYELMQIYGPERKRVPGRSLSEETALEKQALISCVSFYDTEEEKKAVFTDPMILDLILDRERT